ncbi:hypothetical protein O7627_07440 [Solwaraspora sp. WMMD1047]|uniref:hypothetical protein n=1 Tax=Solwaraspora sp. WMMD1047 TaxID=3016102 RepID=UPI0024180E11|nr:hypothetical protein [Solwaraspora sp. WMMD1047]MDG4829138.1 hypothetical protein [Solwaraspora sp. WMMD1047]
MPLQRHDTRPVPRPAGMVPPAADLTGITELRLHGVGGTSPEDLLGDDAPLPVAGDRIAGFYRTADLPDRHVEAYSWGGLTSRSGTRVLWLLLFPFALANVAGWMCTAATHASPRLFRLHRTAVRWTALGLTLNLLLIFALTTMDLLGYQCGGQPACTDSWLTGPLAADWLAGYPGRRLLVGALAPLALVVLLAVLALRSINRYERTRPPWRVDDPRPAKADSSAQPGIGLTDPTFWDGRRSSYDLGCLHIAAGLAFVALTLAHTAGATAGAAGAAATGAGWRWAAGVLGGGALLGAVVLLVRDRCPAGAGHTVLAAAGGALLSAGWYAADQPAFTQPFGYLPGMRVVANLVLGAVFVALSVALVAAVLGGWRRGTFFVYGPFVALVLAVFALNVVLLSAMNRIGALVADVSARVDLPATAPDRAELYLYPIIAKLVPYLTVLPLALLLAFALYELGTYWRAGRDRARLDGIRGWYRDNCVRPDGEPDWWYNTVDDADDGRRRWWGGRGDRWTAQVARARRVARMPQDTDKLLTAMAAVGGLLLVAIQVRYWFFGELPWSTQWIFTLGSYLAASIPVAVVLLLRRGWRNLHSRRRIGVLWDVLTFWPRAYHPLAPPAYAERAVPEVQRRLWRIHSSGGRVVLTSHSQGTVLAAAALLQGENRPDDDVVTLVTFGSPLRTLYGWAFPAYFNDDVLRRLVSPEAGSGTQVYAWRNFYYQTDYIGGPVLGGEPTSEVDVELPDPATCWHIFGQAKPAPTRHSGYWADPAMWRQVDRLAEAAAGAPRIPRQWDAPAGRVSSGTG